MRTISGKIAYLDAAREHWGREEFSISVHRRGRTVRAVSELDDARILRDTNWTLSSDWKPLEGFVRVSIDDAIEAHSWFNIDGATVECEAVTRELGRVSQRLESSKPIDFLGFHALTGDALISAARGCVDQGVEKALTCVTNSFAGYGEKGLIAMLATPRVTYLGPERISVIAGEFAAEHFKVRWSDVVPTYSHFWVHGPDYLPLRLMGASGPVSYELSELNVVDAGTRA
jgi:hypothetical protein